MSPPCGLCYVLPGSVVAVPLPLHHVEVDVKVVDLTCEVTVRQVYVHSLTFPSAAPLNCHYVFPLDESSAVTGFQASLDGEIRQGRVKEKKAAAREYVNAVSQGHSAMLLEQKEANVFECSLGQLHPGSVCTISLTYCSVLDQEGRCNRLVLPMTIAPKYSPLHEKAGQPPVLPEPPRVNVVHQGVTCDYCRTSPIIGPRFKCNVCPDFDLCQLCEAISPSVHDPSHPLVKMNLPAGQMETESSVLSPQAIEAGKRRLKEVEVHLQSIEVHMKVTMASPIVSIKSPSHPTFTSHSITSAQCASVDFHQPSMASLESDFVLLIEQKSCFDPRAMLEVDVEKRTASVALAFLPPPLPLAGASQLPCEFFFLVDRSGSMSGASMTSVVSTMQILLRSLPTQSRFQIIGFGSSYETLFPGSSEPYTAASLQTAANAVQHMGADLGGTEILAPLSFALTSPTLPTHPRQIFLLTDGQVTNTNELVGLVRKHVRGVRLFVFGIGGEVDRSLCKRLARAGNGQCEFVSKSGGEVQATVMRQLARALQPTLTQVNVDWGSLSQPSQSSTISASSPSTSSPFMQCPKVPPAIFAGTRFLLYALNISIPDSLFIAGQDTGAPSAFTFPINFTAHSNRPGEEGQLKLTIPVTSSNVVTGSIIHRLAARARIAELEDLDAGREMSAEVDKEILGLALKYSLTSRCSSFVVVYPKKEKKGAAVTSPLQSTQQVRTEEEEEEESCFDGSAETVPAGQPPPFSPSAFYSAPLMSRAPGAAGAALRRSGGGGFGAPPSPTCTPTCLSMASYSTPSSSPYSPDTLTDLSSGMEKMKEQSTFRCTTSRSSSLSTSLSKGIKAAASIFKAAPTAPTASASATSPQLPVPSCASSSSSSSLNGRLSPSSHCYALSAPMPESSKRAESSSSNSRRCKDPFDSLIELQRFDGEWQLSDDLVSAVNAALLTAGLKCRLGQLTVQNLRQLAATNAVGEEVVAVLLCLEVLAICFSGREGEWILLTAKSHNWLTQPGHGAKDQQQAIREQLKLE